MKKRRKRKIVEMRNRKRTALTRTSRKREEGGRGLERRKKRG